MDHPLPCFACGQPLDPAFPDVEKSAGQPSDAVMFSAYGQYGSTVFDPMDGSQLQINVCDGCLLERRGRVRHVRHVRQPPLQVFCEPWNPDREPGT